MPPCLRMHTDMGSENRSHLTLWVLAQYVLYGIFYTAELHGGVGKGHTSILRHRLSTRTDIKHDVIEQSLEVQHGRA